MRFPFHAAAPLLCISILLPLGAQTGGRDKRMAPVDANQHESFTRQQKLAILAGIGAYPRMSGLAPLRYAAADARELGAELEKQGYKVQTITDSDATRGVLRKSLASLRQLIDPRQGTVIFFFSGHGFEKNGRNYLAPFESTPDDLDNTGLALDEVAQALKATGAMRQMMWIDACRDNPVAGTKSSQVRSFSHLSASAGLRILFSTRSGQVSYERDDLRHGLFTAFLLKGLGGAAAGADGMLTFRDLSDYVGEQVTAWGFKNGLVQVPYEAGEAAGDFLVATLGKKVAPAPTPGPVVYRAGNGVTSPIITFKTVPEYTEKARSARIEGTVVLYLEVWPDGKAHNMKVLRSLDPGLDQKAIEAVGKWVFRPGMKDGKPVTTQATIETNFKLL